MPPLPRRLLSGLCALVALVVLSGCEARVLTTVSVESLRESRLAVTLEVDGEAVEALEGAAGDELEGLVLSRTGVRPVRSSEGSALRWRVELGYEQLVANSDVFGIASARVGPPAQDADAESAGDVAVVLELVAPEALASAFAEGVAGQEDAEALLAAFLGATSIGVRVSFPGPVSDVRFVDGAGQAWPLEVVRGANDATISQPLSEYRAGTMVVRGSLDEAASGRWVPVAATAAAMVLAAVVITRLRGRQRPERRPGAARR